MMGLNLAEVAHAALPMLAIFAVQIVLMLAYAIGVTFRVMGRDYEAAQMAAGNCGFSIGNTANAVASMNALAAKCGPAPQAFLVVPLVGGMLGDLTNAVNVTAFLQWLG
jgi:ESS family glutamate:Na+ symporter